MRTHHIDPCIDYDDLSIANKAHAHMIPVSMVWNSSLFFFELLQFLLKLILEP